MFIGHYAIGFAGKPFLYRMSLGTMFLAVQWLDLLWPVLVLTGIEKVSIETGSTALIPLDFVYYPWSHSLLMAAVWGLVFGIVYYLLKKDLRGAVFSMALVFSHWVLDWITHRPDLPLTPFSNHKVGLGLWNHPWAEISIETLLFLVGTLLYMTVTRPKNSTGRWGLWALLLVFIVIYIMNIVGPPPPSVQAVGWAGVSLWLFVFWAYWVDRNRE